MIRSRSLRAALAGVYISGLATEAFAFQPSHALEKMETSSLLLLAQLKPCSALDDFLGTLSPNRPCISGGWMRPTAKTTPLYQDHIQGPQPASPGHGPSTQREKQRGRNFPTNANSSAQLPTKWSDIPFNKNLSAFIANKDEFVRFHAKIKSLPPGYVLTSNDLSEMDRVYRVSYLVRIIKNDPEYGANELKFAFLHRDYTLSDIIDSRVEKVNAIALRAIEALGIIFFIVGSGRGQQMWQNSVRPYLSRKSQDAIIDANNKFAAEANAAGVPSTSYIVNEGEKPCDPPEGTVCYGDADNGRPHAGLSPHYHAWQMQRKRSSDMQCFWKSLGGKIGVGVFETPPAGALPCSKYPDDPSKN